MAAGQRPGSAPLAVTMGEPAGIGGEIALAAWCQRHAAGLPPFFLIDDPDRLARLGARIGLPADFEVIAGPEEALAAFPDALPVLPQPLAGPAEPGKPQSCTATAVLESIQRAVALASAGRAAGVVTNPIHKQVLYDAGFRHPGHTEYLADLAGISDPPVMMLACRQLRVVPVTVHMALKDAVQSLDQDKIIHAGMVTAASLARDFAIPDPRLAVAGLNPHAGEGGHLGREDEEIVAPAVEALCRSGIAASGPKAADSLFHPIARAAYDAAICMYHDQALIPLKTIDFEGGVNVTLGLPFVRTSPDHGTALQLAGTGKASPKSFMAALRLAADMAAARRTAACTSAA